MAGLHRIRVANSTVTSVNSNFTPALTGDCPFRGRFSSTLRWLYEAGAARAWGLDGPAVLVWHDVPSLGCHRSYSIWWMTAKRLPRLVGNVKNEI